MLSWLYSAELVEFLVVVHWTDSIATVYGLVELWRVPRRLPLVSDEQTVARLQLSQFLLVILNQLWVAIDALYLLLFVNLLDLERLWRGILLHGKVVFGIF